MTLFSSFGANGKLANSRVNSVSHLSNRSNSKCSQQFGDDGIIDWLIERAEIPRELDTFVEFRSGSLPAKPTPGSCCRITKNKDS